jgi:hypothetical protein
MMNLRAVRLPATVVLVVSATAERVSAEAIISAHDVQRIGDGLEVIVSELEAGIAWSIDAELRPRNIASKGSSGFKHKLSETGNCTATVAFVVNV